MALLPIRQLGDAGVITDISNHNLPTNAFTMGVNVRFDEGKVSRAPVFRRIQGSLGFSPRFVFGVQPDTGFDSVVMLSNDYVIKEYANGTVSDRSGSISGADAAVAYTGTTLADVTYISRSDRVPVFRLNSSTGNFADLTNWDSNWRAGSLRSFGDQLVALNLTENGVDYPNRVRFSNITTANSIPDSWDAADTTKSAGFNDIVQMKTPIVDGQTLGSNFIIYSEDQVWMMSFVGGTFVMSFRKLFSDIGMINQNCAVEVEGKHFVFGTDDIYMHDGSTYQSIADQKVKNFVFKGLNNTRRKVCYVQHNQPLGEVYFCYNSSDDHVGYPNADRCNRAAVYNYTKGTWSFYDLPNTSAGTSANASGVETYTTAGSDLTYDTVGGSYLDQEDSFGKNIIMVGETNSDDGITSDKLYVLDLADAGTSAFPLDSEGTKQPYLEREGLDLDEAGLPLSGYKVVSSLYPQGGTINPNKQVEFTFGATDLVVNLPVYTNAVTYDWGTDHKIDTRIAGRYISYKMTYTDTKDFQLTGFDMNVTVTGRR
jgi:hypothetical protein